jgi:hypothetical protein
MRTYLVLVLLFCACTSQTGNDITVRVQIDFSGIMPLINETVQVAEGTSALDCFSLVSNISSNEYAFGKYVTGINGVMENGSHYWIYYVNGEQAMVGADAYETREGDSLLFSYEIPNFG